MYLCIIHVYMNINLGYTVMGRCIGMATKAHLEGNRRYLEKQDSILIRIPKGRKAELQAHAKKQGESLNGFIVRAVD